MPNHHLELHSSEVLHNTEWLIPNQSFWEDLSVLSFRGQETQKREQTMTKVTTQSSFFGNLSII